MQCSEAVVCGVVLDSIIVCVIFLINYLKEVGKILATII